MFPGGLCVPDPIYPQRNQEVEWFTARDNFMIEFMNGTPFDADRFNSGQERSVRMKVRSGAKLKPYRYKYTCHTPMGSNDPELVVVS